MNCPKCGKILESDAVICPNCGETVVENIAGDNMKRSVVSEDVLRNFSDPEHIDDENQNIVFSENKPEQENTEQEDEFFNPDDYAGEMDYKNDDDYDYNDYDIDYEDFDKSFSQDGDYHISQNEDYSDSQQNQESDSSDGEFFDNGQASFEDGYTQRAAVEDYDVFNDNQDDIDDDEDDEEDEDYDSVIIEEEGEKDSAAAKRTKVVLISVLILATLVVICGVIYLVFGEQLGLAPNTSTTEQPPTFETSGSQETDAFMFKVPNLFEMKYSDAVTKAREYGLETKVVYQNSDTVEKGLVISQSIAAGTTGKVGDVITITVSLGKDGETSTTDSTQNTTNATEPTTGGSHQTTTEPTEAPTETPTQRPTEPPTEAPTEPTEPPTSAPTTEPPTEPPTTEPPTTEPPTTEEPTEPPTSAPENNYYLLPDSATRLLTVSDLENLSLAELELARNEIYARHGRRFDTDYIQAYFDSQQWYNGTIDPDDFDYGVLSQTELDNVWFIYNYEHSF